ncbi:MAG: DUF1802 family protein [Cytophagaceae bacterium]
MALAFKEWSFIVEALGKGYQNIILRKGGIQEDGNGFEVKGNKFLLFPTLFHQADQHVKSKWFKDFQPDKFHTANNKIIISYFAEIPDTKIITDWQILEKLFPYHAWEEGIIKERFNRWEKQVHLLIVQTYQMQQPLIIENLPEYSGCKSWIDIKEEVTLDGQPVKNLNIK